MPIKKIILFHCLALCLLACTPKKQQPNILFAIADDQSFPHTSARGDKTIITPAFDALAARGILFNNAFVAAPQCSPSRAAILTGRNIWQLEEAGTHSSYFPKKFPVFTDAIEANGYALGYTGKPWGPGNFKDAGWERNPVGPEFNEIKYDQVPYNGISNKNYTANFKEFMAQKEAGKPFFFWYGAHEPHRKFEAGSGLKEGKKPEDAIVPAFLPNEEITQHDMLDYAVEIEWFDKHLGDMIAYLEEMGELDNTIIVVTADNGMAFPYAKANLQEYGTHVPLVIAGPNVQQNIRSDKLVSLIDLAPTFLDLSGTQHFPGITGYSLEEFLTTGEDIDRPFVLTGRERHTHARPDNLGYPARAIRTDQYLYIRNLKPDRWPAGDPEYGDVPNETLPQGFKTMKDGYHDIDACPSKTLLLENQDSYKMYFDLAVAKRPEEQLFNIIDDPECIYDLAKSPDHQDIKRMLAEQLMAELTMQKDPRALGNGDIFESYPRFGGMRQFPGFKTRTEYNPAFQSK